MNAERNDEKVAKRIVEQVLGTVLAHADKLGGVDYLSADGLVAVEVTRVTEGLNRSARKARRESRTTGALASVLKTCWLVNIAENGKRLDSFYQNVQPALCELENAGENFFERSRAAVHVAAQGSLSDVYKALLSAGVTRASAMPSHNHEHNSRPHRLIAAHDSGGGVGDIDRAVNLLVESLTKKPDNPKKLGDSGALDRHLFVWLDGDTPSSIADPLNRDRPSPTIDGDDSPSRAPMLDGRITHLWVVRERSSRGWLWDGDIWHELNDLETELQQTPE